MQQRADFLEEQRLAERRGQRVILARNLPEALRNREPAQAAKGMAAGTGVLVTSRCWMLVDKSAAEQFI